jgi:hypothetical protein
MSSDSFEARLRRTVYGALCLFLVIAFVEIVRARLIGAAESEFFQGGQVSQNAWHLSVINGGHPRGEHGGALAPALPSFRSDASLNEAQWFFRSLDDESATRGSVTLGMAGALPVTGDFNGDGTTNVGVFIDGHWYLDLNGNGAWDDDDLRIWLRGSGDLPVTGDWDGDGKTDVGIVGPAHPNDFAGQQGEVGLPDAANSSIGRYKNLPSAARTVLGFRTLQHTSTGSLRADPIDHAFQFGTASDQAVSGDFNGDGITTIGIFNHGHWMIDMDGDGKFTAGDVSFDLGCENDLPVVGDFNGDGIDEVGVYRQGTWHLDTNGDRVLDGNDAVIQFGDAGDLPVVGDFNGRGCDQLGIYRVGRAK